MMKRETLRSAFPQDDPFVPNAAPIIKDLVSLHQLGAVGQDSRSGRLKNLGEPFLPHDIDQTRAIRPKRNEYVLENVDILLFVVEVPERRKHAEHEIKGTWAHEIAHVFLHPLDRDLGRFGVHPSLVQEVLRSIDSGDREAPLCESEGTSARAAAQIES
jgi:hypothetical protein